MKQMVNREAPVDRIATLGGLQRVFFRRNGKIFIVFIYGKCPISFPVREDGLVSKQGGDTPDPYEKVEIIKPDILGISEIKWADD